MIKVTCEHNKYSDSSCLLFRIDRDYFHLKRYIYINKQHMDNILVDSYRIFAPMLNIYNVQAILCFSNAIVIDRLDATINDFYVIESVVSTTLQYLASIYQQVDLSDLESSLQHKYHSLEACSFIKCQLTSFIHQHIGDTFQSHGGYCIVNDVDCQHKAVTVTIVGNCRKCRLRSALLSKIDNFVFEITKSRYKISVI